MSYFDDWISLIHSTNHSNTYKVAWGKALIECVLRNKYESRDEHVVILKYDIVKNIMKYYWNLINYFDLKQGQSKLIDQRIDDLKKQYYKTKQQKLPIWHDKLNNFLKRNPVNYENEIKKFISLANRTMIAPFKVADHEKLDVYTYDNRKKQLLFETPDFNILKHYAKTFNQLLNYEWASMLERFNTNPNILKKVSHCHKKTLYRPNLRQIQTFLIEHVHLLGIHDFFTGEALDLQDVTECFILPYNYLFEVNTWNTVLCSKSSKATFLDGTLTESVIEKLEKRNQTLLEKITNLKTNNKKELQIATDNNLLKRYFYDISLKT